MGNNLECGFVPSCGWLQPQNQPETVMEAPTIIECIDPPSKDQTVEMLPRDLPLILGLIDEALQRQQAEKKARKEKASSCELSCDTVVKPKHAIPPVSDGPAKSVVIGQRFSSNERP